MSNPLRRFDSYIDKPGGLLDYLSAFGFIKGIKNYYNCRLRRHGVVCVYYNKNADSCFLRRGSADIIVFEQVFVFGDYNIKQQSPPKILVDAGAHIGLASLYFLQRYPDLKIICLEPQSNNFELLLQNCKNHPNIIPVKAALWYQSETIYIQDDNATSWAFRVTDKNAEIAVKAITVEEILDQFNLVKIDLLKIDIEGAEKKLFSNQVDWISNVDCVVIEVHDHIQPGASTAVENALSGHMQLTQYQGENWVFQRQNNSTTH